MGVVRINAIGPGAVDYLLKGCDAHERESETPGLEHEGREHGHQHGAGGREALGPELDAGAGGAGYFAAGVRDGEPHGVWFGSGMEGLGLPMRAGETAREGDVRAIFGQLRYPGHVVENSTDENPAWIGNKPRTYATYEERVKEALAAEPTGPDGSIPVEREKEIRQTVRRNTKSATAYYDVTFSPVKSVTMFYTALLAAGDEAGATRVREIHEEAVKIALAQVEADVAWAKTGRHGRPSASGRTTGRFEAGTGLSAVLFSHHTNRDGEPQLHLHAAVLNRVGLGDGRVHALDGAGFQQVKEAMTGYYERATEALMTQEYGVAFETRPDGKGREIAGMDPELLAEASTRTTEKVNPRVAELVEDYIASYGREPDAKARHRLARMAVLDTRAPKTGAAGPAAIRDWVERDHGRRERVIGALEDVEQAGMRAAFAGRGAAAGPTPDTGLEPDVGAERGDDNGPDVSDGLATERDGGQPGGQRGGHGADSGGHRADSGHGRGDRSGHRPDSGHDATAGGGQTGRGGRERVGGPVTVAELAAALVAGVPGAAAAALEHPALAGAVAAGLADVQTRYTSWTQSNLIYEIDRHLGDDAGALGLAPEARAAFLRAVGRAVLDPAGDHGLVAHGVVRVSAGDPVPVPASLRREVDGRSMFRAHLDERYTTAAHLGRERALVALARTDGAPALSEDNLAGVAERGRAAGLSPDQIAAVAGIAGSGRKVDVLVGPAGAGKSHTMGALAAEWTAATGGRVIGTATAEVATRSLAGIGGLEAYNTTAFLGRFRPDPRTGRQRDRLAPGDLVVIDEAGMVATAQLDELTTLAASAGAKVVWAGDHHQLQAVEAGGLFAHLAETPAALHLETVHRFTEAWEREASLGLRAGAASAVDAYSENGRLRGGTLEEMSALAVHDYLSDVVAGVDSLLIVGTNAAAADLSREVHDMLVELGRVEATPLMRLPGQREFGVGDRIQARDNDHRLRVDPAVGQDGRRGPAQSVANREIYTVVGRSAAGDLLAVDARGATAHLPRAYVQTSVTYAYAVTANAAQGVTVQRSRGLVDRDADRASAYVPSSRGREANYLYLVAHREPDAHTPSLLHESPEEALTGVLARDGRERAGIELEAAARLEECHLLGLVDMFDQLTTSHGHTHTAALLGGLLADRVGVDAAAAVAGERAYPQLLARVREAAVAGHDVDALLGEAVAMRRLDDVDSLAAVLHWRVEQLTALRLPEHHATPGLGGPWGSLLVALGDGEVGQTARALAERAEDRMAELAEDYAHTPAEQLPGWITRRLGAAPDPGLDPDGHEQWRAAVARGAGYREWRGLEDDQPSFGAPPPREQALARALWHEAVTALGEDAALTWTHASDAELYQARERWTRECLEAQARGIVAFADELSGTYRLAHDLHADAALERARAEVLDGPGRDEALAVADRWDTLAAGYLEQAADLQAAHGVYGQWAEQVREVRDDDRAAAVELADRGLPPYRDADRPEPHRREPAELADQLPLDFMSAEDDEVMETVPDEQELTLDEPPAEQADLAVGEVLEREDVLGRDETAESAAADREHDAVVNEEGRTARHEAFVAGLRDRDQQRGADLDPEGLLDPDARGAAVRADALARTADAVRAEHGHALDPARELDDVALLQAHAQHQDLADLGAVPEPEQTQETVVENTAEPDAQVALHPVESDVVASVDLGQAREALAASAAAARAAELEREAEAAAAVTAVRQTEQDADRERRAEVAMLEIEHGHTEPQHTAELEPDRDVELELGMDD